MAGGGSKPGERRGGRKKGTPNKIHREAREIFKQMLNDMAPDAAIWLRECAEGIEIEKTLADGTTVVGRLNADPGKALGLLLQTSEFFFPKLARTELELTKLPLEKLVEELERRERETRAQPSPLNGTDASLQ